jgi:hypothetical protein
VIGFRAATDRGSCGVTLNESPGGADKVDLNLVELGVDGRFDENAAIDAVHGRVDSPFTVKMDCDLGLCVLNDAAEFCWHARHVGPESTVARWR